MDNNTVIKSVELLFSFCSITIGITGLIIVVKRFNAYMYFEKFKTHTNILDTLLDPKINEFLIYIENDESTEINMEKFYRSKEEATLRYLLNTLNTIAILYNRSYINYSDINEHLHVFEIIRKSKLVTNYLAFLDMYYLENKFIYTPYGALLKFLKTI